MKVDDTVLKRRSGRYLYIENYQYGFTARSINYGCYLCNVPVATDVSEQEFSPVSHLLIDVEGAFDQLQ